MRSLLLALAAAVVPVLAIPPLEFGFPESPNHTELSVAYTFNGNTTVVKEAQLFGGNITSQMPELAVDQTKFRSIAEYTGMYLVLMIDPDAPRPDNPTRRFILHWLAPNISANTPGVGPLANQRRLTNSTPAMVPYAPPGPPFNSSAHRYIIYAFRQPDNFKIPANFMGLNATNRSMFDVERFVREANLGDPAAAEYFYVSRQSSVPGTFIAMAGGQYPGGNGAAVFAGRPMQTPGGGGGGSGGGGMGTPRTSAPGARPTNDAAPKAVGLGSVLGAGLLGLAAVL